MSQTNSIAQDNPLHHVVNLKHNDSLTTQFESVATLTQQAQAAQATLFSIINDENCDAHKRNPRRWIISTFWLLSNIMANDILTSISTFITDSQAVKDTELFAKLELDFITINLILHQFLDLTRQKVAFIRVLEVKSDDFHVNQQHRLFEFLTSTSDALMHNAQHFMEQFSCAMSSKNSSVLLSHLHRTSVMSSIHTSLMRAFKQILIWHPIQKANAFIHSQRGQEVIHWAFAAMKLFASPVVGPIESVFDTLMRQCPLPVHTTERRKESKTPLQEAGTLRKLKDPPASKWDSSDANRPTI